MGTTRRIQARTLAFRTHRIGTEIASKYLGDYPPKSLNTKET